MEREAKAKVVASVWGADFVQFLAALAVLSRSVGNKRLNSSYSSTSTEAKQLAQQGTEQSLPPNRHDDFCMFFSLHPSFMSKYLGNSLVSVGGISDQLTLG